MVSVQNRYNLGDRYDDDVVGYCEEDGIAFIPWFPLPPASWPRRAARRRPPRTGDSRPSSRWLGCCRSPAMLPIPGTSSVEHLEENLAAASLELSDAEVAELCDAED